MTPDELSEVEQRAYAAIKASHNIHVSDSSAHARARDSVSDVPALVAEVRRLRAIVDAVDKLHEPTGTHMVAEIDGLTGEQREIEPDSFEEITSRAVRCMSCAGYPEAPCRTRQAIDAHERTTA